MAKFKVQHLDGQQRIVEASSEAEARRLAITAKWGKFPQYVGQEPKRSKLEGRGLGLFVDYTGD